MSVSRHEGVEMGCWISCELLPAVAWEGLDYEWITGQEMAEKSGRYL